MCNYALLSLKTKFKAKGFPSMKLADSTVRYSSFCITIANIIVNFENRQYLLHLFTERSEYDDEPI
jgi:hypothetical protein